MRFQCPFCSYHMRGITNSMLGRKVRCPDCGKTNHISKDPFQSGRVLGDFIIKRQLGVGSIGAVYFATQISLDRNVALKVLSKEYSDQKGTDAFLKEARAAAKLSHPNLVQSFGVGEEEGIRFMAMNFIEGETVKDKLKREGQIEVDEALHIVQQVAEGLFFAWSESELIHRDVKPENIMLTKEGAVKLTDLGLAISESEWHENMEISGSPSYMSPEQFTGEKIDTRSDIYSLGISLYQMVSGNLPFDGSTLKTVARQHFYEPPKPLNKINPMIPSKVSNLVQKMVEKEPENRFQNMEEVIQAIWKVRQSTAPDKDLIPSVHTISIKRLDYDLQKISQERNEQVKVEEVKEKQKNLIWMKILAIGIPVVIFTVLLISILASQRTEEQKINAANVQELGEFIDNSEDTSELRGKWDEVYNKLPSSNNDFNRELKSRMLFFQEKILNRELTEQNEKLKKPAENKVSNVDDKLKELEEENKQIYELLKQKDRKLSDQEMRLKKLTAKAELLESNKEELKKEVQKLKKTYKKFWQDNLRIKVYLRASRGKPNEAVVVLKSAKSKHPGNELWFNQNIQILELMKKFQKTVSDSGSKYAGIKIDGGKIKNIIGGQVEFIDENDNERQIPLLSLTLENLMPIAKSFFPDLDEKDLYEFLLIMTADIAKAHTLAPNNVELGKICDAICNYKIDMIRSLNFIDEKKAKDLAREFLKEFEGVPGMDEKYKPELKQLFIKE